ncbi:hypothetical protein [Polaromonas sp.]|uniref:hypothetical protein n=1 Tax=Polaromonas sp. TaxID=1869339 RepID=UPI0027302170|nr:hypothetical protein [Polaromonas sp.]MDP1884926.1 hypothetical protein [Polaromonas sp.]
MAAAEISGYHTLFGKGTVLLLIPQSADPGVSGGVPQVVLDKCAAIVNDTDLPPLAHGLSALCFLALQPALCGMAWLSMRMCPRLSLSTLVFPRSCRLPGCAFEAKLPRTNAVSTPK